MTEAGAEFHEGSADHHGNGKDDNHSVGTHTPVMHTASTPRPALDSDDKSDSHSSDVGHGKEQRW